MSEDVYQLRQLTDMYADLVAATLAFVSLCIEFSPMRDPCMVYNAAQYVPSVTHAEIRPLLSYFHIRSDCLL